MAGLRDLLFAPTLPEAPQRTYTPGINYETGTVETPETIGMKTFLDQFSGGLYENLIRPISSPVGAGMTALTVGAPGAAAPLNRLLSALMVPQMVVGGAKAAKSGDYSDAALSMAFAPLAMMGIGKAEIKVRGQGGFHSRPAGAQVTPPARTYNEGAANKTSNVWVRQAEGATNTDRTLLMQFSNDLINPAGQGPKSRADAYYDKLYQSRSGYDRPADFWEIPQWHADIAHSMPNSDVYVVRNPTEAIQFANKAGYKNIAFSALDVNKPMITDFASQYKGKVVVGGYGDLKTAFKGHSNITVHPTVQSFVESEGGKYTPGFDYRHYHGTKTMPRLTMSDGCLHQCEFCSVPKKVVERSKAEIVQQAEAFAKDLPSSLVYINDKTFGQAKNHTLLPEINAMLRKSNPDFQGFVIQTTAAQMKRLEPQFMTDAGIKYAELGIESYNDPILRASKKPATEAIIDSAASKLREAGVTMIPNIMVGLKGETPQTYARTMEWLRKNDDNISHVNVNNFVVYDDAPISKTLKNVTAEDSNQNVVAKSWMADPASHTAFVDELADWGSGQLDKTPRPAKSTFTTMGGSGMPQELQQGPQLTELLNPPAVSPAPSTRAGGESFQGIPVQLRKTKMWVRGEDRDVYTVVGPDGFNVAAGDPTSAAPIWSETPEGAMRQLADPQRSELIARRYYEDSKRRAAEGLSLDESHKVVVGPPRTTAAPGMPSDTPKLEDLLTPPAEAPATAYKRTLKPTDLGDIVEPADLVNKPGFIMPDGTAVRISSSSKHGKAVSQAKGRSGRRTEGWHHDAHDEGLIRTAPSSMGPGAEMYTPPTDAQIRALRDMEKASGFDLGWDLTDPFYSGRPGSLPIVGTGAGVKYIRGEIENKKYAPKRPEPTEPKKTSELFQPDYGFQPSLNALLQPPQFDMGAYFNGNA